MFDLLIFKHSVFKLQIVHTWAVPNCKVLNMLIVRNGNFMLRNVQIREYHPARGPFVDAQESLTQDAKL